MGWDGSELRQIGDAEVASRLRAEAPEMIFSEGEEVTVKGVVFTVSLIDPPRIVLRAKRTAYEDGLALQAAKVNEQLNELKANASGT